MKIEGIIVAAHTPFNRDGSINFKAIPKLATHFKNQGVDGIFIGGTTGEFSALSTEERKLLAEEWADAMPDKMPFIIHIGHTNQHELLDLAHHAAHVGADAICALAPHYLRPTTVEDLVAFFEPVSRVCGLPFYYYDIPALTGVDFSTYDFLKLASKRLPTIAGIKFTRKDLETLQLCVRFEKGNYTILFGNDEYMLAGLALGCRGAVGSTYNYATEVYREILKAFHSGNIETARKAQFHSVALVEILKKYGVIPAGKAILEHQGIYCGDARPPLPSLSSSEKENLIHEYENWKLKRNT